MLYIVQPHSIQTFCSMRPSSSGKWAATNQSPGAGLDRLKVVELCDVTGRIRDRLELHSVAFGNKESTGFITGGAPHRIWLQKMERKQCFKEKGQVMIEKTEAKKCLIM